ncbi:MAG: alpha/beta hydrolase [Pseudonocardia sp.]|nr:alpha/beta hydrolase [Pseudonocardia sp.]
MPLDPQFRVVLDTLAGAGATPLVRGDAAQTRAHYRSLALARRGPGFVPEEVASVSDTRADGSGAADGVPVRVYEAGPADGPVVLYLHGGGWVVGDVDTHDPVCRRVANALRATVVSVDYRLAPEHPFPAGLDDAEAALRWAADRYPGRALGVAGDSAGASLAAGLALRVRDGGAGAGGPVLAAQLLFYPATDPALASRSIAENGEGYFLTESDMRWFYAQYVPDGDAAAPELDLAHADLAGVAPAVVVTAEFDPLRDEGAAFAERLRAAGVPVRYLPGPGLIHGFAAFLGAVDAADATVGEALAMFAAALSATMEA